jgi:hypothetical protein
MPLASWRQAAAVALLAAWTIPPYLAVWAAPYTSADLFFYCVFFVGLWCRGASGLVSRLGGARGTYSASPPDPPLNRMSAGGGGPEMPPSR